ncbi:MAG: type IV pilus assembly protein PilM [bacterium]
MGLIRKPASLLGVDIGASSVKIIEVVLMSGRYYLVNLGTAPIEVPPDDIEEDAKKRATIATIGHILAEKKIKTRRAISGLMGQDVFIRMVNMPKSVLEKMSKDQIIGMLKNEIEAEIPFPLEEATVDFFYYGEVEEERTRKFQITVVVIPQSVIQEHLEILQGAGLRPVAVDTGTFALCRTYRRLVKEEDLEKTVALVEVSANKTEFNIIQNGILQLTRTINVGGNAFTKAISEGLSISMEEAEQRKREGEDVLEAITPSLEKIAEEMKNSFQYYQRQMRREIDKIVLCGGSAKLKDVSPFLNKKLNVPVELLNPLKDLKFDPKLFSEEFLDSVSQVFGVSVGLALRNSKEERNINFLPFEMWERPFFVQYPFITEGVALGIVVGMVLVFYTFGLARQAIKLNAASKSLQAMNPTEVLGKIKSMTETKVKLEADLEIIDKLTKEQNTYSVIINDIVTGLPKSMWLNSVAMEIEQKAIIDPSASNAPSEDTSKDTDKTKKKKKQAKQKMIVFEELKISIMGSALKTQSVAEFMLYLKKSKYFKDVNLINLQQSYVEEAPIMRFVLECTVGDLDNL